MKLVSYITGAFALAIVAIAAISALAYAATHHRETINSLALGTLNGLGMSIGGLLGSYLILRFRSARRFVRRIFDEASV
jgi:uncharacterized membrane protein YfcA